MGKSTKREGFSINKGSSISRGVSEGRDNDMVGGNSLS
jgi:hypothetical protein